MFLMDKDKEAQKSEKARKRKALQEELTAAKKGKREVEVTVQMLAESAEKKAKEVVKKTDVATVTTLLIRVKCFKEESQEIMKTDVPKQEEEIKEMERKLKLLNSVETHFWISCPLQKCVVTCYIFLSVHFC